MPTVSKRDRQRQGHRQRAEHHHPRLRLSGQSRGRKMAKEAEAHADEDKARKEAVEARNLLDSAVYQAQKLKDEEKSLTTTKSH